MRHLRSLVLVTAMSASAGVLLAEHVVFGFRRAAPAEQSGPSTRVARSVQGNDLFQKALSKERAEGQLDEAIQLYALIVKDFAADRLLAAKALLQMGRCYERLGRSEAQQAYERLLRDYGDQRAAASEARVRLADLARVGDIPGPVIRRVWADHTGVDNLGGVWGAPSPDGRYLVYVDWETGCLTVREFATGHKRRPRLNKKCDWTEGFALYSTFSADGKRIAYNWYDFKNALWELHEVGVDSSNPRVLYRNPEVTWIHPTGWSPDGAHILAVVGRTDRTNQIVLVVTADRSVRVLRTFDWRLPQPSFSPDGRLIAYDLPRAQGVLDRDIFLLATDGSRELPLVSQSGNDFVLGWTPDGSRVLFASDRTGTLDAWSMRVVTGKAHADPELVRKDLGRIDAMGFTRNGSYYYGVRTGHRDAFTAVVDVATGRVVVPPAPAADRFLGTNSAPAWSPDGKYLAYNSHRQPLPGRNTPRVLCIRAIETGEVREVTPALDYFDSMQWLPDGGALIVNGRDERGRAGFFRVDASTGRTAPFSYDAGSQPPVLAADGKSLFLVTTGEDKVTRIIAREVTTGEQRELYRGFARNLSLSTDGRQLAFETRDGGSRLKVIPTAGGPVREIFTAQPNALIGALAWMPDGRSLLFGLAHSSAAPQTDVWRISSNGQEPRRLDLGADELRYLRVHPDGQRVAFVGGQPKGEVWVMENFLAAPAARPSTGRR